MLNHETQAQVTVSRSVSPFHGPPLAARAARVAVQLRLVEPVHRLGQGVVEACADGADRRNGADVGQSLTICIGRVLTPASL